MRGAGFEPANPLREQLSTLTNSADLEAVRFNHFPTRAQQKDEVKERYIKVTEEREKVTVLFQGHNQ